MFLSQLLSPETEDQNKNEHMNWISLNVPVVKENILAHDSNSHARSNH